MFYVACMSIHERTVNLYLFHESNILLGDSTPRPLLSKTTNNKDDDVENRELYPVQKSPAPPINLGIQYNIFTGWEWTMADRLINKSFHHSYYFTLSKAEFYRHKDQFDQTQES